MRVLAKRLAECFGVEDLDIGNSYLLFFFNDTATTEIYTPLYTLSLHDALPISLGDDDLAAAVSSASADRTLPDVMQLPLDRKSTRLNSSHIAVSRMPSSA